MIELLILQLQAAVWAFRTIAAHPYAAGSLLYLAALGTVWLDRRIA
jgi:hypothetical protein